MDLTLACAGAAALALAFYVLLDGFDLGVGALMATTSDLGLRDRLAESIEPTWDGNETWLIMAGVALLAAFPVAYAILLPALYLPLVAMLLALGLRAVAFDFRREVGPMQRFWDRAFAYGSIAAAACQGLILGALLQGVAVTGDAFSGSALDALRPVPLLIGVTTILGYAVLGTTWARWRLPAADRPFVDRRLRALLPAACILAILAVLAAAYVQPAIAGAWAARAPAALTTSALLILAVAGLGRAIGGNDDLRPFLFAALGAAAALAGLLLIVFPGAVPFRIDLWTAAAPRASQLFFLVGFAVVAPVVLAYTAFAYWTFRGKLRAA